MVTVPTVKVSTKKGTITYTDSVGRYGLNVDKNDSVFFSYMGRNTNFFPVKTIQYPAGFDIALQVKIQDKYRTLKEVVVIGKSYKEDSIMNRENYRKVFEFGGGGLQLTETGGMGGVPGLDLGSIIESFKFRKNKSMRVLQNRLIEEEQQKYIDHRFTKKLVQQLTKLQGVELEKFMKAYRPDYYFTSFSSDLEFDTYILEASKYFKTGKNPWVNDKSQGTGHK